MNLLPSCSILLTVIAATIASGNPSCEIPKEFLKAVKSKKDYATQSNGGSHSEENHSGGSKNGGSKSRGSNSGGGSSGGSSSGDEDNDKDKRSKRLSLSNSCECGSIARILITDKDGQVVDDLKRCPVCPSGQAPQEDPTYCDGVEKWNIPCKAQRSMPPCVGKVAFYSCCNEDEADTAEQVGAIVAQPATAEATTSSTTTVPPPE